MVVYFFPDNLELDIILRMFIACVCGLVIGAERTRHQKSAGMRTYILVALGATIFTILSKYGFLDVLDYHVEVDVSRVASSIVSGVSFLGAGTIFMRGDRITGLTTAASIWATAAIGILLGTGMLVIAGAATILLLIVQSLPQNYTIGSLKLQTKLYQKLVVCMDDSRESLSALQKILTERQIDIVSTQIKRNKENFVTYTFVIKMAEEVSVVKTVMAISRIDSVRLIDL
jgi:putative Mg2+ transporter-C (MgtC) family protein